MKSYISYFHYSVPYEEVNQMARLFSEFCRLIDNGRFYIACAMGLHRTDIAPCTYWVFYAVDKGTAPPEIRGYQRLKGITREDYAHLECTLQILDGTEWQRTNAHGGVPRERKEIINELSHRTD